MRFRPEKIYIDEDVKDAPISRKILEKYSDAKQITVSEDELHAELTHRELTVSDGKKILHLKRFKGNPFKLCPGFSDDVLCCNYCVIDIVENCPLDCTYCILQTFINKPAITIHVNVEEIIEKTVTAIKSEPERQFRVGTGEHTDSLALDDDLNINAMLVKNFSKLENATLELKTKSDNIDPLINLDHQGRTVVAWSLNPPDIVKKHELKTASLENRLEAAAKLARVGYKIAYHLDPIIFYPDWKKGYQKTVELMLKSVPNENIAWISLGTLRYIPALKKTAEERFKGLSIFSNEFTPAHDGKMRYLKPIRRELLTSISHWIKARSSSIPLYLCMEKHSIWNDALGVCPANPCDLESYLSKRV